MTDQIEAVYVAPANVMPVGVYQPRAGGRPVWLPPLITDAGDILLAHLLSAADGGAYFRYGLVKTVAGWAVVYSGPVELTPDILDPLLPQLVAAAIQERTHLRVESPCAS